MPRFLGQELRSTNLSDLKLALNLQKIPVTRAAAKIGEMARLYGSSSSPSALA
jgi:hypothetical protein